MIHALRRGTNRAALAVTAAFVMVATATPAHAGEIGRASCRERVFSSV